MNNKLVPFFLLILSFSLFLCSCVSVKEKKAVKRSDITTKTDIIPTKKFEIKRELKPTQPEKEKITSKLAVKVKPNRPNLIVPKVSRKVKRKTLTKVIKKNIIRISAVGDIMLDGTSKEEMVRYGYDYPFVNVVKFFKPSDIVFANLEGPLTDRGEIIVKKKYTFRSPPDKVSKSLSNAGFNVVSLANNHTLDYGPIGLKDTVSALDSEGIYHVGAGENLKAARKPAILEVRGVKFAFLAYSLTFPKEFWASKNKPGTAFGHKKHIVADVKKAKLKADIVIVSVHWGRATEELRDYQSEIGRAAVDAGAKLVVGHHPHLLQAVENYNDGVIVYSLGNFVFGSYSKKAVRSVIAQIVFEDKSLKKIEFVPVNINNVEVIFQPRVLEGSDAKNVIDTLNRLSNPLGTEIKLEEDLGVIYY